MRNYAENANEISNPKNTTSRQTKVIIRFVRFHFAFHSDNSGPIPFFFHVGKIFDGWFKGKRGDWMSQQGSK